MKFGAFFLLGSPEMLPAREMYQRVLDWVVLAEELGYDSVWFAEHHFSSYGYIPSPLVFAAAIARETTRVRLGTAVVVLPFSHPLRVAEEVAMVDLLSDGRLDLGLGRGYQPYEFERFGLDIADNRAMFNEALEIMLKAWSTDVFSFEGRFFKIPDTSIFPKPVQQPHPQIWVACQSPETVEATARRGYKCITGGAASTRAVVKQNRAIFDEGIRRAGVDPATAEFGVQRQVFVAESDEAARQQVGQSLWHYRMATRLRLGKARVERGRAIAEPVEGEPSPDVLYEDALIYGAPHTCVKKVRWYRDEVGATSINCSFNVGNLTAEQITRSMRLFATEVMPHFR